jgi:hypothetical protein
MIAANWSYLCRMMENYRLLIPSEFPGNSRVWIYQASRPFQSPEAAEIGTRLSRFANQWLSHGAAVHAHGSLLYQQFILLVADESQAGVSGCSTDSSVHLIKTIESSFGVELFNRNQLAFLLEDQVRIISMGQLDQAWASGIITADSWYFNNTVQTKAEWEKSWIIPVRDSWIARRLPLQQQI